MKKLLILTLTLFLAISMVGVFACDYPDNSSDKNQDHEHSYIANIIEPTCVDEGYTLHVCACGEVIKDTFVNALGHSFINYLYNNDATMEKDGTKTATCDREGCEVKDTITALNTKIPEDHEHSYLSVVTKPTCFEDGYTTYSCSCGNSYVSDKVTAIGRHTADESWTYVIKPTILDAGKIEGICEICKENTFFWLSRLNDYDYVKKTVAEPMCDAPGKDNYSANIYGFEVNIDVKTTIPHKFKGREIIFDQELFDESFDAYFYFNGSDSYLYTGLEIANLGLTPKTEALSCLSKGTATFLCDVCNKNCEISYAGDHVYVEEYRRVVPGDSHNGERGELLEVSLRCRTCESRRLSWHFSNVDVSFDTEATCKQPGIAQYGSQEVMFIRKEHKIQDFYFLDGALYEYNENTLMELQMLIESGKIEITSSELPTYQKDEAQFICEDCEQTIMIVLVNENMYS